ncbi:host cell attachment-required protein [Salinisphaera sp. PC39]|uniref:host attachment protein n=1 Tax=Salinisphaera sp. PC39 TaxID=1304156 RepID=UPI00334264C1
MGNIWILAAGGGKARLFEADGRNAPLHEIRTLTDTAVRQRSGDIQADAPGRSFDRRGPGRHAMVPRQDPTRERARHFAAEIADVLDEGRREGRYTRLYLLAEPRLLGQLRDALDTTTRTLVAGEVDKDLSARSAETIRAHLPDFL